MPAPRHGRTTYKFSKMRKRILEGNPSCWLCGQPGADTVDHIVPLKYAPELGEVASNLAPAHRSCNSRRGARLPQPRSVLENSRRW